jgi:hypothetical protein
MTGMTKYGFRIRTRGGMTVENLVVQARTREDAEIRIRQITKIAKSRNAANRAGNPGRGRPGRLIS